MNEQVTELRQCTRCCNSPKTSQGLQREQLRVSSLQLNDTLLDLEHAQQRTPTSQLLTEGAVSALAVPFVTSQGDGYVDDVDFT